MSQKPSRASKRPRKEPKERLRAAALSAVAEAARHRDVDSRLTYHDLACLIDVVRGKMPLAEASADVQRFFQEVLE